MELFHGKGKTFDSNGEWRGGGVALGSSAESDSSPLPLPLRSTNRSVNTGQKYVGREERAIIATR